MKPAAAALDTDPVATTTRVAALGELRAVAAACEAAHIWDQLAGAADLKTDPGATFVMVASLVRAFESGMAASVDSAPTRLLVDTMLGAVHSHCVAKDFERRLGNRFAQTSHLAGPQGRHWLLASLATPPLGEFAERVYCLHYLVALAVLGDQPRLSAARRVADVARMSRTIITWGVLMRELPDPAAHPTEWPRHFAEWAHGRISDRSHERQPPAINAFCRALLALLDLTRRDIEVPKPQASLLPEVDDDLEARGEIRVATSPGPRSGPRAARRERRDDDEHPQLAFAYFQDADEERLAGQEPTLIALHLRDEVLAGESAAAPVMQEQERRLASFQLADIEQSLRWSWDHLNSCELRLVVNALREQLSATPVNAPAMLAATVLATGTPVEDVLNIALSPPTGRPGIDAAGQWTRLVLRPEKAWLPDADATELLQANSPTLILLGTEVEASQKATLSGVQRTYVVPLPVGRGALCTGELPGC